MSIKILFNILIQKPLNLWSFNFRFYSVFIVNLPCVQWNTLQTQWSHQGDFVGSTLGPLKAIDKNTFEFRASNFAPDRDLTVFFGKPAFFNLICCNQFGIPFFQFLGTHRFHRVNNSSPCMDGSN